MRLEWEETQKAIPQDDQHAALFRELCQGDLFFLLRFVLGRADADCDFVFDRCREVQRQPDECLDLWARLHYKSTIITFALTIQDILNDPEITVAFFSHTKATAAKFYHQVKRELETNVWLRAWFPDVLYASKAEASAGGLWHNEQGLIVKRKGNPKEATLSYWGLVDGMPTGGHYSHRIYDDIIDPGTVTTPENISKAKYSYNMSQALRTDGGIERVIGTRYHFNDPYAEIINKGLLFVRKHVATKNGQPDGEPILLKPATLESMRIKMGPYVYACQMFQDPRVDGAMGFKDAWLRYYEGASDIVSKGCNIYMLVDPANEKKKDSDYTAIWVWGLGTDGNMYWLDGVRDRLNLTERADAVIRLHRKWRPSVVGYERYGVMADIQYIHERNDRENYRFGIVEVGGQTPKPDRIRRLIPRFSNGEIYIPRHMLRTDYEGHSVDLVQAFVEEEFKAFPVAAHDDMLDAASRLFDIPHAWPEFEEEYDEPRQVDLVTGY